MAFHHLLNPELSRDQLASNGSHPPTELRISEQFPYPACRLLDIADCVKKPRLAIGNDLPVAAHAAADHGLTRRRVLDQSVRETFGFGTEESNVAR